MNTHSKTSFIILAIVTIVSVLLSSCGQATPTTAPAQPGTQAPLANQATVAANNAEKVKLSMWGFSGSSDTFTPEIIKRFEAQYPNITVEYTDIPEDTYPTKLETAMMAGAAPDIATLYKMEWQKGGKFVSLNDLYASQNVNLADVDQGGLFWSSYGGNIYAVGSFTSAVLLFYNRAMFDAAKLPYPSATEPMTVDEYAALAAQLTKKGSNPEDTIYGADAPVPYWWSDYRTTFSEDGTSIDGIFNSESNIHLYDVLAHMVINGDAPSTAALTAMGSSSRQDLLVQGKMAMVITDSQATTVSCEANHIPYGAAPVPVAEKGDKPWVFAGTDMEGIPAASKNIEAAKTFLAFYLVEGNKLRLENGDLPYNMKLANDLNWAGTGDTVGRQSELTAINLAGPAIIVPGMWDVVAPVDGAYQDIIDGKSDTKTALEGIMPQMKATLATAWETWNAIK
ncbi:MAG: extracellular solute-binding protein [Anaerolineales bacterium]|jgi:multiple sugar transport system substrate-binding protein